MSYPNEESRYGFGTVDKEIHRAVQYWDGSKWIEIFRGTYLDACLEIRQLRKATCWADAADYQLVKV